MEEIDAPEQPEQGDRRTPRYNFGPAAEGTADAIRPPTQTPPLPERIRVMGPGRLAAAALGIGASWQALLYGQDLGIGVPLWIACGVGALLLVGSREGVRVRWRNVVPLAAALMFFAGAVAERANEFVTFLNISACLGIGALLLRLFAAGHLTRVGAGDLFGALPQAIGKATIGGVPVVRDLQESLPGRPEIKERTLPVVRGLLLAAPVLAVFIALFSSADAVFARGVWHVTAWLFPADIAERLWRVGLVFAVAWGAAGALAGALTRREPEPRGDAVRGMLADRLGFTEGMMVLGSVLCVFVAFIAIQAAYLFGGSGHVLAVPGLTYAEYARRGFEELVWVALLTVLLLLGLRATVRRDAAGQRLAFQTGGTLLVGLTLVMLASALRRMAAYEAAYGATDTRLYVDASIVWLGVALIWLGATLWQRAGRGPTFAFGALVCAVGFVGTLDVENVDAQVVRANVRHAAATGRLDTDYLEWRGSEDAIPALLELLDDPKTTAQNRTVVARRLRQDLERLRRRREKTGWPSTHLARERGYQRLKAREAALPSASEACAQREWRCE